MIYMSPGVYPREIDLSQIVKLSGVYAWTHINHFCKTPVSKISFSVQITNLFKPFSRQYFSADSNLAILTGHFSCTEGLTSTSCFCPSV
jgi:hypothetical protein